jgi:hypothetical protein
MTTSEADAGRAGGSSNNGNGSFQLLHELEQSSFEMLCCYYM